LTVCESLSSLKANWRRLRIAKEPMLKMLASPATVIGKEKLTHLNLERIVGYEKYRGY